MVAIFSALVSREALEDSEEKHKKINKMKNDKSKPKTTAFVEFICP